MNSAPSPKVTVYLPTKNRASLLEHAIASVQAQSYENWELIVVDDGSTDATPELLADLMARDPRIRSIRNDVSVGGAGARNLAIQAATGEFVTGLDDDDSFEPDRLSAFVQIWDERSRNGTLPAFLYSHLNEYVHGRLVGVVRKPNEVIYEDMFYRNVVGNQVFAPRENFLQAGLFRESLPAWQDLEFFMRMLRLLGKGGLVDRATYNFDNTPRSDRISLKKEDALRQAYAMVRAEHAHPDRRLRQRLQLQLFVKLYGIKPTQADFREFLDNGAWFPGLARLLRAKFQ